MKKKVVIIVLVIVVIAGCWLLTSQLNNINIHEFFKNMHGG